MPDRESRRAIYEAKQGWQMEAARFADVDDPRTDAAVCAEVAKFVTIVGSPAGIPRGEFQDQVIAELATIPVSLLLPAIALARRHVYSPQRFVSWIFEHVRAAMDELEREGVILDRLIRALEASDDQEG